MIRVSSDWTLFYKFFLPVVWIVFFGIVIGVLLITIKPAAPIVLGGIFFYLGGITFLYFTLLRLKRVEGDDTHIYVTNYFKTFRYTFDSIAKITTTDLLIFRIVTLHFVEKTSFGRHIYFIGRRRVWEEYLFQHEELAGMSGKKV